VNPVVVCSGVTSPEFITIDNNGNTISSAGIANTYDFENRMLMHGAITPVYDGDGKQISETLRRSHNQVPGGRS